MEVKRKIIASKIKQKNAALILLWLEAKGLKPKEAKKSKFVLL
jgi:hypothetical protein